MRTSADDWLEAGLVLLRERGADALTIEALCRGLGRTKGSFYHHFADIDAYQERLLVHWEARSTAAPIEQADQGGGGAERRRRLYEAVGQLELHVESAVMSWALHDARVREARARVDERRVEYLARIWREQGATAAQARSFARLEYAAFLGAIQIFDLASPAGSRQGRALLRELIDHLASALPSGGEAVRAPARAGRSSKR